MRNTRAIWRDWTGTELHRSGDTNDRDRRHIDNRRWIGADAFLPRANTNTPIIMIAERIADLIMEERAIAV
jgi:choline dehydrogenase-like flavoprotein